jgi:hypothetical protein
MKMTWVGRHKDRLSLAFSAGALLVSAAALILPLIDRSDIKLFLDNIDETQSNFTESHAARFSIRTVFVNSGTTSSTILSVGLEALLVDNATEDCHQNRSFASERYRLDSEIQPFTLKPGETYLLDYEADRLFLTSNMTDRSIQLCIIVETIDERGNASQKFLPIGTVYIGEVDGFLFINEWEQQRRFFQIL